MLPPNARLASLLALIQAGLVLLLVPLARPLQASIQEKLANSGISIRLVVTGIGIIVILLLAIYYFELGRRSGLKKLLKHLLAVVVLLVLITVSTVTWLEFTHIPPYALFAVFYRASLTKFSNRRAIAQSLVAILMLTLVDEGLQGLHPDRYGDLHDIFINSLSGCIGLLLISPFIGASSKHQFALKSDS